MYQVSDENVQKVESYFVEKVKNEGTLRFEATIVDIAEGSGVALATAHKAIKQLSEEKKITIIKPSSRRFPICYIYNGSIRGFETDTDTTEQIEYLKNLVQDLKEEVAHLSKENKELVGKLNIINNDARNKAHI